LAIKKHGREQQSHQKIHGIKVRITHADWIKLKAIADSNERHITAEVRMLIRELLKNHQEE